MTMEIGVVFAILGTSMLLFVTGWIRADIVALLVLVSLAATGVLNDIHRSKLLLPIAMAALAGGNLTTIAGPRITLWSTICFDPWDSQHLVSSKLHR